MNIDIVGGRDEGRSFTFDADCTAVIGREENCDVRIHDDESSRHHAKIVPRGNRIIAIDLDSTNGTWVKGQRIGDCLLSNGDEITIGHTVLRISGIEPEPASNTTLLRMTDHKSSVVMALQHEEADVLAGRTTAKTSEDILRENVILREICGISQIVAAETDSTVVLSSVLNRVHDILKADSTCVLNRSDEETWQIVAKCGREEGGDTVHVSKTIVQEAVKKGRAILSADPLSDDRFGSSKSIVVQSISSALCCPMKVGGAFRCVLWIDRRRKRDVFNAMDLRLAASAANMLGLFLEKKEYEEDSIKKARLAAIGEVIAGLAHYIKNVVTGFRLSIDALKSALREKRMDYVELFADSVSKQEGRISDLMLNMLSYAKEREPIKTSIRVADVIASVADPYQDQFSKEGICFEVDCQPNSPNALAEEMSLHRAFLNLLTNSHACVNAKPDGSKKVIRTTIAPAKDGAAVRIQFYDSGTGIEKDKLDRIFEAFYSTKGSGGTGLGLAVVQKIVEEHGGEIAVDSEHGQWTEFSITLPAAEPTA